MAFNNRRSWRLKFIDIDSSFVLVSNESPINGYIVARAPKGNVRATYFPRGSNQAIDALMGVGSAHWPDLLEAKAFNEEYPLYISAPPGTSSYYPSQLAGFYITKNGLYKFYGITDKLELQENSGMAFKVKVQPGREQLFNGDFANKKSHITIMAPELEDYGTDPSDYGFDIFEFKHDDTNSALTITKDRRLNVTQIDYDKMENGLVSPLGTTTTYWGDNDNDLWEFTGQSASMKNFGIKYNAGSGITPVPLKDWIGEKNYELVTKYPEPEKNMENLMKLLVDGYFVDKSDGDELYELPFGLQDIFNYMVSIKDDVYCYFMQKSPTEISTNVKISMIGYDKYRYDKLFNYAPYDKAKFTSEGKLKIQVSAGLSVDEQKHLNDLMTDNQYVVFCDPATNKIFRIGEYVDDGEIYYKDVTSMFTTQYITCQDALYGDQNDEVYHKIFYVESATKINKLNTEESLTAQYGIDGPALYLKGVAEGTSAPKNTWFNALTVSCSEQVYVGKTTSGGEFTGSLDEYGKDSFGGGIYFPEILHDDDVSFIEVRVLKKFGDDVDDLDEHGFWTHKRIVDPYDMDKDGSIMTERNFTIEGDRFTTLVMTMNLLEQKTGGIWRNEYSSIIEDGLLEATLPEYDDVMLFMEPTGQEQFKPALANINRQQEMAAVISPKILQANSRGVLTDQIAQRVVVSGRISTRANAQYAGEFEYYDSVALKKYWCQPIGDVGCNICRILERKYGGWAPAWYNIAGDLGGQLKRPVLRSRYQFEDEATHTLDTKGINPIVYTSDDGLMIVSQKTTQDPNFVSDWSFLGHALSFILVKREIRDNVMRPQIMKPINDYWMSLRQTQVENILAKRTGGSSPIWAVATCDILGQNTPLTKAQRNFVIKVAIKVNVFSETVTLILENLPQTA